MKLLKTLVVTDGHYIDIDEDGNIHGIELIERDWSFYYYSYDHTTAEGHRLIK